MFVMHFCFVCNMNRIGRVFVIYILVVAATGAAEIKTKSQASSKAEPVSKTTEASTTKAPKPNHVAAHVSFDSGMGVASISGVDSRYGRLSSISGIKVYPSIDSSMIKTDSKGNFILKSTDGKMPMPITITKQGDGVSGTIRIMPGSVSVSSSANSGGSASASVGPKISDFNPWPTPFMKPMMNDLFFPDPFPAFPSIGNSAYHTRISEPAYHRIPESFPRIPDPTFPRIQEPSFPRIPEPSFPRMSESSFPRIRESTYPRIPEPAYPRIPQASFRMPDPWMGKDMFKTMSHHGMMSPSWYYPSFSPYFNYW